MNEVKAENVAKVTQVGTSSWSWNSGLFSGWVDMGSCSRLSFTA